MIEKMRWLLNQSTLGIKHSINSQTNDQPTAQQSWYLDKQGSFFKYIIILAFHSFFFLFLGLRIRAADICATSYKYM